jgi:hypothetical protein
MPPSAMLVKHLVHVKIYMLAYASFNGTYMGLTKRRDGYYVQFPVRVHGSALELAPESKVIKRWKAGAR